MEVAFSTYPTHEAIDANVTKDFTVVQIVRTSCNFPVLQLGGGFLFVVLALAQQIKILVPIVTRKMGSVNAR